MKKIILQCITGESQSCHKNMGIGQKLCNLLYLLADSPVGGRQGVLYLTQDDLADLLGISRANLTRGLAQLRRQGILRTRRGLVELLDLPALAQCCSEETHP